MLSLSYGIPDRVTGNLRMHQTAHVCLSCESLFRLFLLLHQGACGRLLPAMGSFLIGRWLLCCDHAGIVAGYTTVSMSAMDSAKRKQSEGQDTALTQTSQTSDERRHGHARVLLFVSVTTFSVSFASVTVRVHIAVRSTVTLYPYIISGHCLSAWRAHLMTQT